MYVDIIFKIVLYILNITCKSLIFNENGWIGGWTHEEQVTISICGIWGKDVNTEHRMDTSLSKCILYLSDSPKNSYGESGINGLVGEHQGPLKKVSLSICIILLYNMYYFHFTLQEPC